MKGYKAFGHDWTCRGFQYKVGNSYSMPPSEVQICNRGFHFCEKLINCFDFYTLGESTKIAEVEATGAIFTEEGKSVTSSIRIIREIPFEEVLSMVNSGKGCYGRGNTGDYNFGDFNVGSFNMGAGNLGDRNVGDRNIGDSNFGDRNCGSNNLGHGNVGRYNLGNLNTGDCNVGNRNAGPWNLGSCNSGCFNVGDSLRTSFNKPTNVKTLEYHMLPGVQSLILHFENNIWIDEQAMSFEEKVYHPNYKTTGGYLKNLGFGEACAMMWGRMKFESKRNVLILPNFDPGIFKEITRIDVFAGDNALKEWFDGFKQRQDFYEVNMY